MDYNSLFYRVVHFVVMPLTALSFLLLPLTNDARIYLGVANIASRYFPFPQNIDLAWEIKPVINRLINYILYQIASFFVPMENHFWFGLIVKLSALIVVTLVCWYFAKQINIPYTFATTFLMMTTMANFFVLQAEYWMVVISLLCITLLLTEKPSNTFIAGALIPILTFVKGISGLMVVPILCAVFLMHERPFAGIRQYVVDHRYFILGGIVSGLVFVVLQLTIWPHIVSDTLMSPILANAANLPMDILFYRFILQFILLPLYFPIMVVGIVFGFYYIARLKYLNDRYVSLAYILLWVVPGIILIPQNEMFMYQFEGFGISALVTMILAEKCLL